MEHTALASLIVVAGQHEGSVDGVKVVTDFVFLLMLSGYIYLLSRVSECPEKVNLWAERADLLIVIIREDKFVLAGPCFVHKKEIWRRLLKFKFHFNKWELIPYKEITKKIFHVLYLNYFQIITFYFLKDFKLSAVNPLIVPKLWLATVPNQENPQRNTRISRKKCFFGLYIVCKSIVDF